MDEDVKIGIVYRVQPEPPDPEECRWFDAGAVRLGLEYRVLDLRDDDALARAGRGRPAPSDG